MIIYSGLTLDKGVLPVTRYDRDLPYATIRTFIFKLKAVDSSDNSTASDFKPYKNPSKG